MRPATNKLPLARVSRGGAEGAEKTRSKKDGKPFSAPSAPPREFRFFSAQVPHLRP